MVPQPDILLAHADPAVRAALARTLGAAGHRVAEASSGDECLRLTAELRPAVALLAHTLPDLDGPAVCRALRAGQGTRHILCALIADAPLSGHDAAAQADLADAWLVRPFGDPELLALVRLLLRTSAAEQHRLLPAGAGLRLLRASAAEQIGSAGSEPIEVFYQNIVQTAMDGFWIVRASDARFLTVNDAYCHMSGYSRDELLAMCISDIEAIENPQDTAVRISRLRCQGHDCFETRHRRKDGTLFDVEVSVRVHAIERGEALIVVFARDITASKQAQETLRRSEARYRSLLSAIPDRVFRHDAEGRFTDYHAPRDTTLIMPPEMFLGKHYHEVVPPEISEPFAAALARARRSGQVERFEYDLPASDGTSHSFETRVVASEDQDVVTIVRNITDRRQAETAQEHLGKELARKNRELEQIVYVASHDLRSPLVNVQGFSRELQASLEELRHAIAALDIPAEQRAQIAFLTENDIPESLSYILTGVSKMDALLKGLLRLSRLGRAALCIAPIDVGQIIAETLIAFDFQIKQAGVRVELGALPRCKGDPLQVGQVFANLISNALKYLVPGRLGMITITGERADGMAVYCVADNGLGIAAEHQDKIFELYYRLDPARSEGEGLGLTIVRTIVDRHGGWVRIASTPGVGSQFFVALPETL
ncbi:MAG: PAS domain S-box protein [Chloroflexales bacterium]|nr:PAS domain S-box protein [Chloroflexales bacterium]